MQSRENNMACQIHSEYQDIEKKCDVDLYALDENDLNMDDSNPFNFVKSLSKKELNETDKLEVEVNTSQLSIKERARLAR